MSFSERPHAWCTPIGLLAVIGPSRNDQRGPPAVWARSFSKMRFSSQKRSMARSMVGKSGTFGTGRYIFIWDQWQKGSTTPEKSILASARVRLAPGPIAGCDGWRSVRRTGVHGAEAIPLLFIRCNRRGGALAGAGTPPRIRPGDDGTDNLLEPIPDVVTHGAVGCLRIAAAQHLAQIPVRPRRALLMMAGHIEQPVEDQHLVLFEGLH